MRVQAHLRELARDDWDALEDRHARDLTWLRGELEQVARTLDVRGVALDVKRPAPAPSPFTRCDLSFQVFAVYPF